MSYEARLVPLDGFAEAVRRFRAEGGKGLNVTVPFKEQAWSLVDEMGPTASQARAINTITFCEDARLRGDNTDGLGLVRDLVVNHSCVLAAKEILVLGAGGAVRGILQPLLAERPNRITIANRTAHKAVRLAQEFSAIGPVTGCGFEALKEHRFDLVINATSAGLQGQTPAIPEDILSPRSWCYDMVYSSTPTPFVQWSLAHGAAQALDGLGMLVEQAAESFAIWRGIRPDTEPVLKALR
jgi:shikimate dehydrogenase